jgi:hypothetical protein
MTEATRFHDAAAVTNLDPSHEAGKISEFQIMWRLNPFEAACLPKLIRTHKR